MLFHYPPLTNDLEVRQGISIMVFMSLVYTCPSYAPLHAQSFHPFPPRFLKGVVVNSTPPAVLRSSDPLYQAATLTSSSFSWNPLGVDDCCNPIPSHRPSASVSIYARHLTPSPPFLAPPLSPPPATTFSCPSYSRLFLFSSFFHCFYWGTCRYGRLHRVQ